MMERSEVYDRSSAQNICEQIKNTTVPKIFSTASISDFVCFLLIDLTVLYYQSLFI